MTSPRRIAFAAAVLALLQLGLWWPGIAMVDTIGQYTQALAGVYDDWHPPIMARLWSVLHPLGPGGLPMFVVQALGYWCGIGLIAAALARAGSVRSGWAVIVLAVLPLFVAWQSVVLKDAQMLAAMLAAVGIVARARLGRRPLSLTALAAVVVLLCYAVLVRTNAVFAVVPLAVMLLPGRRRLPVRGGAIAVLTLMVLAVSPIINHRLFAAEPTSVGNTLPLFDVVGIAHFGGDDRGVLTPDERAMIVARHCYQPFFWDPIGSPGRCGAISERFQAAPPGVLQRGLVAAIMQHPLAYARHRLAHLNSTTRWLVPAGWTSAAPPAMSEVNTVGLDTPGKAVVPIVAAAGWMAASPLGWPVVWIVVAAAVVAIALRTSRTQARDLALALAVSALALEASFGVVSIASDLRYHLWPMLASALAAILIGSEGVPRRAARGGAVVLAVVIVAGLAARAVLPAPPPGYTAMLSWDGTAGQAVSDARQLVSGTR
jgi:hypothetical protein